MVQVFIDVQGQALHLVRYIDHMQHETLFQVNLILTIVFNFILQPCNLTRNFISFNLIFYPSIFPTRSLFISYISLFTSRMFISKTGPFLISL
jgi:hypothetical protein